MPKQAADFEEPEIDRDAPYCDYCGGHHFGTVCVDFSNEQKPPRIFRG